MRVFSGVFALLLSGVFFSSVAGATTLVHASIEELARASEIVAHGRVVDISVERAPRLDRRGGIYTRVTLAVERVLAGQPASEVVFLVHGGRIDERAMHVHGQASFARGEEVVVFLFRDGGALFPTGMSQGKWRVARDEDGRPWATSSADVAALVTRDARGGLVPFHGTVETLSLAALEGRVRAGRAAR